MLLANGKHCRFNRNLVDNNYSNTTTQNEKMH